MSNDNVGGGSDKCQVSCTLLLPIHPGAMIYSYIHAGCGRDDAARDRVDLSPDMRGMRLIVPRDGHPSVVGLY